MKRKTLIKLLLASMPLCPTMRAIGATITANPGDNLQFKLDAAANGTLNLGAGTFNVTTPLVVHTGTTLQGAANLSSHLVFNLTGTDASLYAMALDANARGVTIQGIDLISNHGILKMMDGNGYSAIHLIANNLKFSGGVSSNGVDVFGINATIGCTDLEICWNYFHDSPNSIRNWEVWSDKNSHIDHNLFYNIADGGHFLEPTLNNTFSWNYGTSIHRMGQEIQGSGKNESGLICDHDVFYDFVNAYNDTEGMSVCPNFTTGVVVSNGYFRNSLASGSAFGTMTGGAMGGPNRFGYALESIAPGIVFQNNTIVLANLSADAIASGEDTTANNNTIYGGSNTLWGVFGPDYGPTGAKGTFNLGAGTLANVVNATLAGAPQPPANTFAGPAIYAATNNGTLWTPNWSPPASSAQPHAENVNPFDVTATPTIASVALAWPSPLSTISIHTFTPVDDCGTVTLAGPATSAVLTNLNAGWCYTTIVSGTLDSGSTTGSVTFTTAGRSPDGTKATLATLSTPRMIVKEVETITTSYNQGVPGSSITSTETYFSDGTQQP